MQVETATSVTEDPAGPETYRPHLDGLRALAVYLVVFFHAGSSWFSGGYVGVDVFFVLSGYLVTQLLLRDVARSGSIRFGRFYARRFRRLLPAAFVVLIVTGLIYTAIASPTEVASAVGSFKAAFLYVTNWYFIHHSNDYFGPDINANPVVQFWSLAVEEQFYLLWPLTLGGAFYATRRLGRRRQLTALRWGVAVGAVASALWALHLRGGNPTRAYYGTDARAYELLAGALLALLPGLVAAAQVRRRLIRFAPAVCVLLLLLVASGWVSYGPIVRGIAVTIVTATLLLALEAVTGGIVKRALSSAPMVYLGKISYGTYLWHWIVILVLMRSFHVSTLTTVAIACFVATALASLSFSLMEHPLRVSRVLDGHRRVVIAAGLAISVLSAFVIVPKIVDPADASSGSVKAASDTRLTAAPSAKVLRRDLVGFGTLCARKIDEACEAVSGSNGRVLLMGDSQSFMYAPLLTRLAIREHLELWLVTIAGCPWQRNLYSGFSTNTCKKAKEHAYGEVLAEVDPDLVVLAETVYGVPGPTARGLVDPESHFVSAATIERETRASITALRSGGHNVLIMEPQPLPVLPSPMFNPLSCLANVQYLEQCRFTTRVDPWPIEDVFRNIARDDPGVRSLDLDAEICPLRPLCDPMLNGIVVKRDEGHLTPRFASSLAPYLGDYLRSWASTRVFPAR